MPVNSSVTQILGSAVVMKVTPLTQSTDIYVFAVTGVKVKDLGLTQHWRGAMIW